MKRYLFWLSLILTTLTSIVFAGLYTIERGGKESDSNSSATGKAGEQASGGSSQNQSDNPAANSRPTSYTAKVGKFQLELDSEYVIVIHKDGTFDGVDSTDLRIARAQGNGVAENLINDSVKIEAYPTKVNGTRDQFVTSDTVLQASSAKEERALVDGADARRFTVDTLGRTVKIYFENGGTTYLIEAWDTTNPETELMLEAVVRGFNFL